MMRLSLLLLSAVAAVSAIPALREDSLIGTAEDLLPSLTLGSHYGDPAKGCAPDEKMFRVQGIEGDLCTPECKAGKCPSDVPDGVTAHPMCGLKTPDGTQYCVLLCQPGENLSAEAEADMCGDAKCRTIKGQPGVGICTYDVGMEDEEDEEIAGAGAW